MNDAIDRQLSKQITVLNEQMVVLANSRQTVNTWPGPAATATLKELDRQEETVLNELMRAQVARLYNKFFPS